MGADFTHPRSKGLFRPTDVHVVDDGAPERHVLRRRLRRDPPRAHQAHLERQVPQTGDDLLVEEALEELVIHLQSDFKIQSRPLVKSTDVRSTRWHLYGSKMMLGLGYKVSRLAWSIFVGETSANLTNLQQLVARLQRSLRPDRPPGED